MSPEKTQKADGLQTTLILTNEDISDARRLLSKLTAEPRPARLGAQVQADRRTLVGRARATMHIRKAREEFFSRSMLGEPGYDLLLTLYLEEEQHPVLTVVRLADLARLPLSTANRWLGYLESKVLIVREMSPDDRRASIVRLSEEGRAKLDAMFNLYPDCSSLSAAADERQIG